MQREEGRWKNREKRHRVMPRRDSGRPVDGVLQCRMAGRSRL